MLTKTIELFNIAEMRDGVLYRYPLEVCDALQIPEYDETGNVLRIHRGHRAAARSTYGAELRFVTEAREITVLLETEQNVWLSAYNGDFQCGVCYAAAGKTEWTLRRREAVDGVNESAETRFSRQVWRIAIDGEGEIKYCGIRTEHGEAIRPPEAGEEPRFRLLAYGSSISQGIGSPYPYLNYLNTAAQILNIDVLNKAISGGCFCEKKVLEYLFTEEVDAVYLELGTNIADRPKNVIEERVGSFIDAVCLRFPDKKIFMMTPIRGLSDVSATVSDYRENFAKTRETISAHAEKHTNAVLLDGHKLLDKEVYLSADVLHPSAFGHICMGRNFAAMLAPYLREKGKRREWSKN